MKYILFLLLVFIFVVESVHTKAHKEIKIDVHGYCKKLEREMLRNKDY